MRDILWRADAWDSYVELQQQKTLLKRVNALVKDIQRNGYKCSYGKPEMLKHDLQGLASVRIDKKNRLVFRVSDKHVDIVECGTALSGSLIVKYLRSLHLASIMRTPRLSL